MRSIHGYLTVSAGPDACTDSAEFVTIGTSKSEEDAMKMQSTMMCVGSVMRRLLVVNQTTSRNDKMHGGLKGDAGRRRRRCGDTGRWMLYKENDEIHQTVCRTQLN